MEDNVSKLYRALLSKNYKKEDLGGEEDDFRKSMSDKEVRKNFYDWVKSNDDFGIGSYDDYEKRLSADYQPAAQPQPAPDKYAQKPASTKQHFTMPTDKVDEAVSKFNRGNELYKDRMAEQKKFFEANRFNPNPQPVKTDKGYATSMGDVYTNEFSAKRDQEVYNSPDYNIAVGLEGVLGSQDEVGKSLGLELKEVKSLDDLHANDEAIRERIEEGDLSEAQQELISRYNEANKSYEGGFRRKYEKKMRDNLNKIEQLKRDKQRKADEMTKEVVDAPFLTIGMGGYGTGRPSNRPKWMENYDNAIENLEDENRQINAYLNGSGAWQGIKDTAGNARTWDSWSQLDYAKALSRIARKTEAGEKLSDDEQALVESAVSGQLTTGDIGERIDDWYRYGTIAGQSAPFMVDFIVSGGGFRGISRAAGRGAVKAAISAGMKNLAKGKALVRATGIAATTLGDIAAAGLLANTIQMPKTASDAIMRNIGYFKPKYEEVDGEQVPVLDEDGNQVFETEGGKSISRSIYEAETSAMIENYTEMFGEHLGAIGKGVINGTSKVHFLKGMTSFLTKVPSNKVYKTFEKGMKMAGINGFVPEVLEEELAIPLNYMFLGEGPKDWNDFKKQQMDILGGIGLSVGFMNAVQLAASAGGSAANAAMYRRAKNRMTDAARVADFWLTNEVWAPIREKIDETDNDNIADVVNEILSLADFHPEEQKAVVDYANRLLNFRGYNLGTMAAEREGRVSPEAEAADAAYTEGANLTEPDEMADAKAALDVATDRLIAAGMFEAPEKPEGLTEEQSQIFDEYLQAKNRYDGMVDAATDNIDAKREEAEMVLQRRRNHDGMIYPASTRNGERVYEIGARNTGTAVCMTEDGYIRMYDRDQLTFDEPISYDEELARVIENIRDSGIAEAEASIDGRVVPEVGNTVAVNADGQFVDGIIEGIAADGSIQVNSNGAILNVDVATLQQWADEKRRAKFEQQEEVQEPQVPVVQHEYAQGDTFQMNIDGHVVTAEITRGANADGKFTVNLDQPVDGRRNLLMAADEMDGLRINEEEKPAQNEEKAPEAAVPKENVESSQPVQTEAAATPAEQTEAAAPVAPQPEVQVQPEATAPVQPEAVTEEAAPLEYEKMTVQDILADLHNDLDTDEVNEYISAQIAEKEKTLQKLEGKKPKMSTNKVKYLADKKAWSESVEAARKNLEYWQGVNAENESITNAVPQPEVASDSVVEEEPIDVHEAVARMIGGSAKFPGIKITPESFRRETGYAKAEQGKYFGVIASKENGGVSIERAGEIIMESGALDKFNFSGDSNDVRNMIIEILSEGNPRGYVKRHREELAQKEDEAERNAIENFANDVYHMTGDDFLAYEETIIPEMLVRYNNFDENDFYSQIANDIEAYDNEGTNEQDGGSGEVLPEPQTDNQGGSEAVTVGNQGTETEGGSEVHTETGEVETKDKSRDASLFPEEWSQPYTGDLITLSDYDYRNGVGVGVYTNPKTNSVDVILAAVDENSYVGYFRIYDENGNPTNQWSSKMENAGDKSAFKNMVSLVQEKLPSNAEYTEQTSVSTDGLRNFENQLKHGWQVKRDSDGNIETSRVAVNMASRDNEFGINGITGFDELYASNNEEMEKITQVLTPYLEAFGLGRENIHFDSNGYVDIDIPIFVRNSANDDIAKQDGKTSVQAKVEAAEKETNTSPTEAQAEAGNYKKGHVKVGAFNITIEKPAGSERKGVDANGKPWSVTMANTYGYILGTEGVDGDHIDVFLSNDMDQWNGEKVFVVDQTNTDGTFDEHKCMLGFNSMDEATAAYYANYSSDWKDKHPGIRITGVPLDEFNKWIASSHRKTKPFADYASVKNTEVAPAVPARMEGESLSDYADRIVDHNEAEKSPELTADEIESSNLDQITKDGALSYIKGNINFATQVAYQIALQNVRNTTENTESGSTTENETLMDASVSGNGRRGSRGSRGKSERLDAVSDTSKSGTEKSGVQGPENINDVPVGEQSNVNASGGNPTTDGVSSRSDKSGGSSNPRGKRNDVSRTGGKKAGNRTVKKDAGGKFAAERNAAIDEINSLLDDFMNAGKDTLSVSVLPFNAKQLEIAGKLLVAGVKLGYTYIKEGIYNFDDWMDKMREKLYNPFTSVMKLTDAQVDEFIHDMWNYPYTIDGETKLLKEWASIMEQEKLRSSVRDKFADKRKAQEAAESIPVEVGNMQNIVDTLPYLLPQQQEDVRRAEVQFFDETHSDREHGYGKGYLFTNGTGTGKTYTGLGIVKRFLKQGKGRILILTPSQAKVKDWTDDAKNLGIDVAPLESTKDKGKGVVVTTFANLRTNKALMEDAFDLIVYDEAHRIMENKAGVETIGAAQHYMISNKNVKEAIKRLKLNDPFFMELKELSEEYKTKKDRVYDLENDAYENRLTPDGVKELDMLSGQIKEIEDKLNKMNAVADNEEERLKPQAEEATQKTKVVFLSATPFNTVESLIYTEGYIFSFPEENSRTAGSYNHRSPREDFLERNFGAGFRFRYGRIEKHVENPEALSRQEVQFSDYLENQLGTKSGRIIDSEYDYSRDFPTITLGIAPLFNGALQEVFDYKSDMYPLSEAFRSVFFDYNYSTALFETMKISAILPRIREHLERGRKVVIFHRRKASKYELRPPFEFAIEQATEIAELIDTSTDRGKEEKESLLKAISAFKRKYKNLLEYEQRLNYKMPREQVAEEFGSENVLFFSGSESKKEKNEAIEKFNSDDSGKNIIVIQEASGKEGISLHDTTGSHQRVLITLALPQSPITALQIEGRIYRIGNKSNAIFEYPLLGLNLETALFGQKFNQQVSTTENLALGTNARNLRQSFANGVIENSGNIPLEGQGIGGKAFDNEGKEEVDEFDKSVLDYYGTQKLKGKRNERAGIDYFPTPEPVGFKMVEWGRMEEGDDVLEPSAGNGAIARYVPRTNSLTAVEPSGDLFSTLQLRAGGQGRKFVNSTFEEVDIKNKYDVILMNPPYGTEGKMAIDHLSKAFVHLNEGGRIVAIIPRGSTDKKFDKWYEDNASAVMVGEILMPNITFKRAGTSVSTRIVVIDKVSREETRQNVPSAVRVDLTGVENIEGEDGMFEAIRSIDMPRRTIDEVFINIKNAKKTKKNFNDNKIVYSNSISVNGVNVAARGCNRFNATWNDLRGSNAYFLYQANAKEYEALERKGNAQKGLSKVDEARLEYYDTVLKTIRNVSGKSDSELMDPVTDITEDVEQAENTPAGEVFSKNASDVYSPSVDTHTVTGEQMFMAKPKKGVNLPYEEYKKFSELAKKNNGYWNRTKKGFHFQSQEDVDKFLADAIETNDDGIRYRGYIGKSMSRNADEARSEGRFPKGDFKKNYDLTDNAFDVLNEEDYIDGTEWHHTSAAYNKTHFYSWNNPDFQKKYSKNSAEVKRIANAIKSGKASKEDYDRLHEIFGDLSERKEESKRKEMLGKIDAELENLSKEKENALFDAVPHEKVVVNGNEYNAYKASNGLYVMHTRGLDTNAPKDMGGSSVLKYGAAEGKADSPGALYVTINDDWGYENKDAIIAANMEYLKSKAEAKEKISDNMKEKVAALLEQREAVFNGNVKEENEQKAGRAKEISERLNLGNIEIVTDTSNLSGKKAKAKGWYNPKTGKIVVVIPNNGSVLDVEQTILHEAVAHYGLRKLFGADFTTFLHNVFSNASPEVRERIIALAKKHGWSFDVATEEYLAGLAENTNFEEARNQGWWDQIKDFFISMLRKVGIAIPELSDNELRYILWSSYENLKKGNSAMALADDIVMRNELGIDNLYRMAEKPSGQAYDEYNSNVKPENAWRRRWFNFVEAYVDGMKSVDELQNAIVAQSGHKLEDHENTYWAINRMSSMNRSQTEEYKRKYMDPLIEEAARLGENDKNGLSELNDYLMAKHGLERNEVFRKRELDKLSEKLDEWEKVQVAAGKDPADVAKQKDDKLIKKSEQLAKKDYSGLTELTMKPGETSNDDFTARAEDIVSAYEDTHDTDDLWKLINKATKASLKKGYESGMLSRENYEYIRDMFEYYVPLQGWGNDRAEDYYEYLGNGEGKITPVVRKANGRTSMADDIIPTIAHNGESAIIGGNRNVMKQHLLNFVEDNQTDLAYADKQWYVHNSTTDVWEEAYPAPGQSREDFEQEMKNLGGEAKQLKRKMKTGMHMKKSQAQEHVVKVMRNGQMYNIFINGNPRAAQAINGMLNPENGDGVVSKEVISAAHKIKNFMALTFTSLNPAFVFTNAARDIIFSNAAIDVKEGKAYARSFKKNLRSVLLKGKTISLIRKYQNGELDDNVGIERYFDEFVKNGGETGFTELNSVDEYKKKVKKAYNEAMNGKNFVKAAWDNLLDGVEFMNRAAEDMSRFTVYMTSRQMGRTVERSVRDAKEISVNFNTKGSGKLGARYMNFAYVFFNAAVQSLANFAKLVKNHPVKFTGRIVGRFVSYGMLLPLYNMLLSSMMGDDDSYWNLPKWVRENNLVFYIPFSEDKYWNIPLPHEIRPLYSIGENAMAMIMRKENPEDAIQNILLSFSGMLPMDFTGNSMDPVVNLTPTFAQPIVQISRNTDFFGKKIYNDNEYLADYPEWVKSYKGTSPMLVSLAKYLNEVSGGDNVKSGKFDINPAWIEHVVSGYFGGMGKTINQTANSLSMIWDEDARMFRNIPIASSFLQESDPRYSGSGKNEVYFKLVDELKEYERLKSGYKKEFKKGDPEYKVKLEDMFSDETFVERYKLLKSHIDKIDKLRTKKQFADEEDKKKIDDAINKLKSELIEKTQ